MEIILVPISAFKGTLKQFTKAKEISRVKIVVKHENVVIRCDICQNTFATGENLRRHIQTVHEGGRKYKCVSCDKTFRQLSDLYR